MSGLTIPPPPAQPPPAAPGAGWFPDPHNGAWLRYFDGTQWTDQTAGAPLRWRFPKARLLGRHGDWQVAAVLLAAHACVVGFAVALAPAGLTSSTVAQAVTLTVVDVPVGLIFWRWLTCRLVPPGGPIATWPDALPSAPGWYPLPGRPDVGLLWDGRRFSAASARTGAGLKIPWYRRRPLTSSGSHHRVAAAWLGIVLVLDVLTLALLAGDIAAIPTDINDLNCGTPPDSAYRSSGLGVWGTLVLIIGVIAYRAASRGPVRDGRLLRFVLAATVATVGPMVWFYSMVMTTAANCGL